jgi:hypothetical protein
MSLTRIWTPSDNFSGGGPKRIIVVHTMEGFTGPNGAYDCAKYFQGNVGASSQVCIDNNLGKVWEGVTRANASWTQCNYNGAAVSCEQSGFASWSRSYWLANRDAQLHNIADWIAEESRALGIPITDLTSSQAQGSGRGVCYHSELGSAGCGHSDPGGGWPLDVVLDWARGGTGTAPPEAELPVLGGSSHVTAASAYDKAGRLHHCAINTREEVCYKGPNGNWYPISTETWHRAQSGLGMVINQTTDEITITWTQKDGDAVHIWQKHVDDPEQWHATRLGASYL